MNHKNENALKRLKWLLKYYNSLDCECEEDYRCGLHGMIEQIEHHIEILELN